MTTTTSETTPARAPGTVPALVECHWPRCRRRATWMNKGVPQSSGLPQDQPYCDAHRAKIKQDPQLNSGTWVTLNIILGDTVEWESQSSGHYGKVKRGTVVQVVKAGGTPNPGTMRVLGSGFGMSRKHDSYLVRVGNIAYWPRVKHLRVVSPNVKHEAEAERR